MKKGVISPHLVPDATFIDPELMHTVPAHVTAATGLDALTHSSRPTPTASRTRSSISRRSKASHSAPLPPARRPRTQQRRGPRRHVARASLYGGLCLGPVNTAAVHALAYPLGGDTTSPTATPTPSFSPHVFRFNAEASPERHADVARALGAAPQPTTLATALAGAAQLEQLTHDCGVDTNLTHYGIDRCSIPHLAAAAMTVQRLLRNNPRDITQADAEFIYAQCFRA